MTSLLALSVSLDDPSNGDSTEVSGYSDLHKLCEDEHLAQFHHGEIEIGRLIGKGTFSLVHEVKKVNLNAISVQLSLSREKARANFKFFANKQAPRTVIKQLNQKKDLKNDHDDEQLKQGLSELVHEAKVLSNLNHANVVQIYALSFDCHEQNARSFILMERLKETLVDRLLTWRIEAAEQWESQQPTSRHLRERTFYAYQIASALKYLHQERIIFRDVKPQCIGFLNGEIVKLFDFGLCVEMPSSNKKDTVYDLPSVAGTPQYMSPELLMDQPYNEQTDVYSWAMVFHEMLTLESTYADQSMTQVCVKVCVQKVRPRLSPFNLPKQIQSLLLGSWEHKIGSRTSMTTVCKTLESILGNKTSRNRLLASANGAGNNRSSTTL